MRIRRHLRPRQNYRCHTGTPKGIFTDASRRVSIKGIQFSILHKQEEKVVVVV